MDILFEISKRLISNASRGFKRSLFESVNWDARLIEITGSRGVGKTTMMLQYLHANYDINDPSALYISLDDPYFYSHSLIDTVDYFVKYGGKHLFIDEVHKYIPKYDKTDWAGELKASYDRYPGLRIVYSGSSIIGLYKGTGDLSRRVSRYHLPGLSFREYLEFNKALKHRKITLEEILTNHMAIATGITGKTTILQKFAEYIKTGYYPFYNENREKYFDRLINVLTTVMESDIPAVIEIPYISIDKMKKLLSVISTSSPYTPNLRNIGQGIGITDQRTLLKYLTYLEKAEITRSLSKEAVGNMIMRKPAKLYLNNTNLCYALEREKVDKGTLREIFFYNQLDYGHTLTIPEKGDFLVNGSIVFEIGGRNKTAKQIGDMKVSYLAVDEIETGQFNRIPLWLFGFVY